MKEQEEITKLQKEQEDAEKKEAKLRKEIANAKRAAGLAKAREAKKARKEHPLLSKAEVAAETEGEDGFTPAEIKAIEEEARKEVRLEKRKKARAELKASIKRRLEQEMGVTEAQEDIFVDLGGRKHNAGATYLMLDGVRYQQDRPYKVRSAVAAYMRELMQQCDSHQCEIEGNSRRYNRERNTQVGPLHINTPSSALLRV